MAVIEPNGVYTVQQVAELLGLKTGAVRKWIRDGKVRAGKLGKSYLIVGADLLAAIRGQEASQLDENQGKQVE